jgi:hypothetical protein
MSKNVKINAGAVVIVEVDGGQRKFNCSGTNEKTGASPTEVLKHIQDCIKRAIADTSSRKSRKSK